MADIINEQWQISKVRFRMITKCEQKRQRAVCSEQLVKYTVSACSELVENTDSECSERYECTVS